MAVVSSGQNIALDWGEKHLPTSNMKAPPCILNCRGITCIVRQRDWILRCRSGHGKPVIDEGYGRGDLQIAM